MNEQPDDANGDVGGAQPGDVTLFIAMLVVGIVVVVVLLYGFFWLMWIGN